MKKRMLSLFLGLAMLLQLFSGVALATDPADDAMETPTGSARTFTTISRTDYTLADGATESALVVQNGAGTNNTVHVIEVDMSSPSVSVMPTYKGIDIEKDLSDSDNWGTQKLSEQAAHFETDLGLDVLGGINVNNHFSDHSPFGILVWNGEVFSDEVQKVPYLVVDEDGNASFRDGSTALDGSEWQAISGFEATWLVKNGVNQYTQDKNTAPRTAIGLKADGSLVMMVNDGRLTDSPGLTVYECAEMMLTLGCTDAILCDGGGSATMITQREKQDLQVCNTPSDGAERAILGGLLVVSNIAASGICGANLAWTLYNDGLLSISGTGAMDDYDEEDSIIPWDAYSDEITRIVIGDGVTSIGARAFNDMWMLESVEIADSVESIGAYNFCGCSLLASVLVGKGVKTIGDCSFYGSGWDCEEAVVRFLGDAPEFEVSEGYDYTQSFCETGLICYYPAGNATWLMADKPYYVAWLKMDTEQPGYPVIHVVGNASYVRLDIDKTAENGKVVTKDGTKTSFIKYLRDALVKEQGEEAAGGILPAYTVVWYADYANIAWFDLGNGIDSIYPEEYRLSENSDGCWYAFPVMEDTFEEIPATLTISAFNWMEQRLDKIEVALTEDSTPPQVSDFAGVINEDGTVTLSWTKDRVEPMSCLFFEDMTEVGYLNEDEDAFISTGNFMEIFTGTACSYTLSASDAKTLAVGDTLTMLAMDMGFNENTVSCTLTEAGNTEEPETPPEEDNKCGDNLTWSVTEIPDEETGGSTDRLTISGTGEMWDFEFWGKPWESSVEAVSEIVLPDGLTHIGANAFYWASPVTEVTIPASVTSIGDGAFAYSKIAEVTMLGAEPELGENVFAKYEGDDTTLTTYVPMNDASWVTFDPQWGTVKYMEMEPPEEPNTPSEPEVLPIPEVTAAVGYKTARLSWTCDTETAIERYTIYSCDENGENRTKLAAVETTEYTLTIPRLGTQYYIVTAVDENGKTGESDVVAVTSVATENEPPVAVITPGELTGTVNSPVTFSGVNSTDNDVIVSYAWDFGDGSTGSGEICEHSYEQLGIYTVTLTVTDESGNTNVQTAKVNIYTVSGTDAEHALLTVTVLDAFKTGAVPVSGARVMVYTADDTFETQGVTGADGTVKLVVPLGSCTLLMAADGYVSRGKTITVTADENGAAACEIGMTPLNMSVVDGELKVAEMTRQEIIDAGIDVTAPENQQVWKYTTTLEFKVSPTITAPIPVTTYINSHDEVVSKSVVCDITDNDDGGSSSDDPIEPIRIIITSISKNAYMIIYGEVHWLKEMFNVELLVTNNSYMYDITDCTATLELPEGMSLAAMVDQAQTETIVIGAISKKESEEAGFNSARANWYVRGDAAGEYFLTAHLDGMLDTDPITATFTTDIPVKVYAGSALELHITVDRFAAKDLMYPVTFELRNVVDRSVYNISMKVLGADFQKAYDIKEVEYGAADDDWNWAEGALLSDHDLKPGESLKAEFRIRFGQDWSMDEDGVRYMIEKGFVQTSADSTTEVPVFIHINDNTYFYPSNHTTGFDVMSSFFYDEDFFTQNARDFNPELAYMTLCLASSAYNSAYASVGNYDAQIAGKNVSDLLTKIGFENVELESETASYGVKPGDDTVAAALASKPYGANGTQYTLIAVAVRGGNYEREWHDNFLIGEETTHEGFSKASYKVIEAIRDYIKEQEITGNVKIWITGYSRASATANLTAARLLDGAVADLVNLDSSDLYAYCFATPANTRDTKVHDEKYAGIFSIVNPVDAVPMVAPADWGFDRYGTILYLPSAGLSVNYPNVLGTLENAYAYVSNAEYQLDNFQMKKISPHWIEAEEGELIGEFKLLDDDNNSGMTQEGFLLEFLSILFNEGIGTLENYVDLYEKAVCDLIGTLAGDPDKAAKLKKSFKEEINIVGYLATAAKGVVKGELLDAVADIVEDLEEDIADAIVKVETDLDREYVLELLDDIEWLLIKCILMHPNYTATLAENVDYLKQAHFQELYLSWMRLLQSETIFDEDFWESLLSEERVYRRVTVKCPVDVEVYEVSGAEPVLVARVVDKQVQPVEGSSMIVMVDENEQIIFYLPSDGTYELKITATGDGELNYSLTERNLTTGERKQTHYYAIAITEGDELTGFVSANENNQPTTITLTGENNEVIAPDETINGVEPQYHTVEVITEGSGSVLGSTSVQHGDFVTLRAVAAEGEDFLGWYVDGELVSADVQYRFNVQEDMTITAKFTQPDDGEDPGDGTTPDDGEDPDDGTTPDDGEDPGDGTTPDDGKDPDDGTTPDNPSQGGVPGSGVPIIPGVVIIPGYRPSQGGNSNGTQSGEREESADSQPVTLPFTDVAENDWFFDGVRYVYGNGLMNGTSANTFAPYVTTSRAMIVTVLWRMEGSPVVNYAMNFDDVDMGTWYTEAIRWAASEKIVEGYAGKFNPNDSITREQLAAILWRYAKYKGFDVSVGENTNILSYNDAFDISEYAIPAMQWACGAGVIGGKGNGILDPHGNATRAEVAVMLERFCSKVSVK